MTSALCFTIRFLDPVPRFHGRGSDGDPEWPPSPLRLFQALVSAAATRWRDDQFRDYAQPALHWLEGLSPSIIAPQVADASFGYRMYVPNNSGDLMTAAWARGDTETSMAKFRVEKDVRPTHLSGGEAVHYLYPLPEGGCPYEEVLKAAARSITHLGWGVDMVAADAKVISQAEADKLPGHRWRVVPSGGTPLRVPKAGTLADLMRKHQDFLGRLSADGFKPVPPLQCFDVVGYHSPTVPSATPAAPRPVAAFEIHRTIDDQEKPENAGKSRFRPFHQVRRVATVAGMVRHAAAEAAKRAYGWDDAAIGLHVHGHDGTKQGQATSDERLMFLPLPSITPNGVSGIRRVLVVGWPGFDIAPLRRLLNGAELIEEEKGAVAMLSHVASTDKEVRKYTEPAAVWSTVTPVILPGHDDPDGLRKKLKERDGKGADAQKHLLERLDTRVLSLLWKAFEHAGWTADALAGAELEYRTVGWLRGLDLAKSYDLPGVKFPRYHVRVTFPRAVPGPLAVGAGRYRGFGLFVRHADERG